MKSAWLLNAHHLEKEYGAYVNWDEDYYICPECGEPVYECDWEQKQFWNFFCPICEWECEEEGEED